MSPNFCFFRCTYLVIFTRLWATTARSYHLDITQLGAPYSSCILEFALLYHSLHVSTSLMPDEGPKAIPSTNWVPSRVLFSDVNFSRKHDFQSRFCSQCVVQPSPKSKRMNEMRVQTVMMIQIYQGNQPHCHPLFTSVSPLPFLSYRIKKLHISGWTNASPMTFMAHRPQKDHHYPRISTTLTHISTRQALHSTNPTQLPPIHRIPPFITCWGDPRTGNTTKQIPPLPNQVPLPQARTSAQQPNSSFYPTRPSRTGLYQNRKHENLWRVRGEGEGNHSKGETRFFFSRTRIGY